MGRIIEYIKIIKNNNNKMNDSAGANGGKRNAAVPYVCELALELGAISRGYCGPGLHNGLRYEQLRAMDSLQGVYATVWRILHAIV